MQAVAAPFRLNNGYAFTNSGLIDNLSSTPMQTVGTLAFPNAIYGSPKPNVIGDAAIGTAYVGSPGLGGASANQPGILPQLLGWGTPASLGSAAPATLQHGTGNAVLTLTGINFLPGVAVLWNGSYRTTTLVSSATLKLGLAVARLVREGPRLAAPRDAPNRPGRSPLDARPGR